MVAGVAQGEQLEDLAERFEDDAQALVGELALQLVVAPFVDAQVDVAAQKDGAQVVAGGLAVRERRELAGGLADQRLAAAEQSACVAEALDLAGQTGRRQQRLETVGVGVVERVGGAASGLGRIVVEAHHVEQVGGGRPHPHRRGQRPVLEQQREVGELDGAVVAQALELDLLGHREQVGAAGLKAAADADEHQAAVGDGVAGALEVVGQGTPDELVGQALLAGAALVSPIERGRRGDPDEAGVEAGAAHGGGRKAAAAPADVAEQEGALAVVAQRQTDGPFAALEAMRGDGTG